MKHGCMMQFLLGMTLLLDLSSATATNVVYEDGGTITDDTVFTSEFMVNSPGIYQAELVDFGYSDPFAILALAVTQGSTFLNAGFDTGSFTFEVATPGLLQAHLAAIPLPGKFGTYALQILSVPLPPAVLLFLSGMLGFVLVSRRERA
jgi:hypothetical protein